MAEAATVTDRLNFDEAINEETIDAIQEYLATLKFSTWGRAFSIVDANGRRVAAKWLHGVLVGLAEWIEATT